MNYDIFTRSDSNLHRPRDADHDSKSSHISPGHRGHKIITPEIYGRKYSRWVRNKSKDYQKSPPRYR